MTTISSHATSLRDLFDQEGLPMPPIDEKLEESLQPLDDLGFATARWSEGKPFEELPSLWLADAKQERAHARFSGHGLVSTAVEVALVGPWAGLFVRRQWSAYGDAEACHRRITGAFALLGRLHRDIAKAQAEGRFPTDRRFVLIDDEFELQRCGWVPADAQALPSLPPQALAYVAALTEIDGLR